MRTCDMRELELLICVALENGATPDEIKDIVDSESEQLEEFRRGGQQ